MAPDPAIAQTFLGTAKFLWHNTERSIADQGVAQCRPRQIVLQNTLSLMFI